MSSPERSASRRRGLAINLALAAVSLALVFGVVEIALRLRGYEAAAAQTAEGSIFWRRDPLLGWSNEPGVSGVFVGPRPFPIEYRTPVEINSQGLRGPEIAALPAGGVRVLVLGDSLVAGFEVTQAETFVALTETRLARSLGRPVQMLNAGVRGYGTDQSLLYFRERGRLLEPNVVVYIQSLNDPGDNMTLHRRRRPFGKPAFSLAENGSLTLAGLPLPDYPLCTSWGLDSKFAPQQMDGVIGRAACTLQMHVADHSALFTFAVMQGTRNPLLARLLLRFADLAPRFHNSARGPRVAGFPPLQVPAQPRESGPIEASYALTSALVRQLAVEVRATGAEFVWIVERSELPKLDRAALERDGIQAEFLELGGNHVASLYFVNDAHMNWRGHLMASLLLSELLARRVGTPGAPAQSAAD